jgi:hypothetical protein
MAGFTGIDFGLAKLWEVVASGVGALGRPWQMKREARAQIAIDKMKLLAARELDELRRLPPAPAAGQQPVEGEFVEDEQPIPLVKRVEHRLGYQEAKRQMNIEDVVVEAQIDIEEDPEVSSDPVDEDWIARFFTNAQDVSTDQMKNVWAKVLAGEVRRPGTFSLRSLEVLRNMTSAEARLVASLGTVVNGGDFVFETTGSGHDPLVVAGKLSLQEQLALIDLGVLNPTPIQRTWLTSEQHVIAFADVVVVVPMKEPGIPLRMSGWMLTAVGRELLNLFDATADREHVKWLCRQILGLGNEPKVHRIMRRKPLEWEPAPIEL